MTKLIYLILICLLSVCCVKQTELNGEVFLKDQDSGNYKFKAVQINVFPEEEIKPAIAKFNLDIEDKDQAEYDAAKANLREVKADYEKLVNECSGKNHKNHRCTTAVFNEKSNIFTSAQYRFIVKQQLALAGERMNIQRIFENFPPSEAAVISVSDSDGRFTVRVPKSGNYVLAAKGERKAAEAKEEYYWLILVEANGETKKIELNSENTIDSGSPDSIFKTLKY